MMAKRGKRASLQDVTSFHTDVLDVLLSFCASRGVRTLTQLSSFNGRALLDVPIWKLLETEGNGSRMANSVDNRTSAQQRHIDLRGACGSIDRLPHSGALSTVVHT
jgi:hypothetical protein